MPPAILVAAALGSILACAHASAEPAAAVTEAPAAVTEAPAAVTEAPAPAPTPSHLSRQALREDLRELVRILEEAHPDPYSGVGGRVSFHKMAHGVHAAIPEDGMSVDSFYRLARPLVAALRDGHTRLHPPLEASHSSPGRLGMDLDVTADRVVFVSRIHRPEDRPLLGARLLSVEGVGLEELRRRQALARGFDNELGNLRNLLDSLSRGSGLAELLEREVAPEVVEVELKRPDGSRTAAQVPLVAGRGDEWIEAPSTISLPEVNAADLAWGFLDDAESVALLRIDSAARYREAFELWHAHGFSQDEHLMAVAAAATEGDPPEGMEARLAAVPSATETFGELFGAMRDSRTGTLVVDLRRNGGGNSLIASILAHFLFGSDGLDWTSDSYQIPRYSELFFENNRRIDRESFLESRGLQLGDYDFSGMQRWQAGTGEDRSEETAARMARLTPTFSRVLENGPVPYSPTRLIVLTSAHTYSAGFDIATMLYKRGAILVGVPSAQAGNCFIDTLRFQLPNTGLNGGISFKRSVLFPEDEEAGRLLVPALELTYERLAELGFDPQASVILASREAMEGALASAP